MVLGASLIKALFGNILEKFGSDILGNWNLSENIEIHSFSPLDLELTNFPVPQILFDIAELPFVIVYSNIENIRICVNSDQIVSKSNPINIKVKNVDIQIRLANPDEWNISKWSKKILKSKKKRLKEWEKFVSPWSTKSVDNSLTQSIETSIVNSLVINAYNIHAYIIDDDIGDSPFTFEIFADTLKISSPYKSLDLCEQEKDGLNSNLLQFLWIRFYGFRIIYKKFNECLLCSISKNITPSKQYEDNLTVDVENNNKSLLSFLQSFIPFIRSDNQYSNEKLSALDYLCCSFGIRSPLKELNICNNNKENMGSVSFENSTIGDINKGKRASSTMNLFNPKHTQNGNSKFIDIPDNCSHAIELTPDAGIEMHILFKRWDIRALKAPISMFPLSCKTQEDVINFISSCKWKVSKLIFLPKSNLYIGSQPPNTEVGSNSPIELTFTVDALNALFNFINYINEWTSFLKAIQAIYYNRKTRAQMESYLVSMINANRQNYTISGISNFSASLLSSLEDELPINDIIALQVAANYYVREKLVSLHQLWIPCSSIKEISLLSVQEFLNELETRDKDISNLSNNGSYNKVEYSRQGDISTFKHWFDFDSALEVAVPNIKCNILLTAIDDMDTNIRPFPSWMKSLIVCNLNSGAFKQKFVNLLGICSTIVIDGTIYMIANKITFCHRKINIRLGNFSIYEREIGLISVRANLNETTLDIDGIYLDKKHEQQNFKSLQKFTSIVVTSINLDFLPCFRILNIESVPIVKMNTKVNNWNSYLIPNFVYKDDDSNRNNRHISNYISIKLHQFYSSADLTHMRNQLSQSSSGFLIQDNYVVNEESNGYGFNYIYIKVPNLNISNIKSIWRLSNILPLCKSKIGHLLMRCKKTYETDLIRSLFTMMQVITKQNEKITINLRCLTISSLFPPDETFTTFSAADLFYIREKQIFPINLDNIHETQTYKNLLKNKDLNLNNNNQNADFALFKVESYVKAPKLDNEIVEYVEDTNTSGICPNNLENKVLRIISDICSRPNFFINNLKSYHIMESSQSVCKDDNKVFWSMEDLKIPFDTLDSSESLLYNDILQYFVQNGYIIELSTCMSGCKLLFEHLFMEISFSDISLVVSLRHLGISSISSSKLEMYILDIKDLFLRYKGLTLDLKLICIQINLTPISVALLSGYEFLIFPMQGVTDLPKLFAKLASFSDKEVKKKKTTEKSSKSLLSSLQNLSLSIQFLGLHVYDSNSLAFDFMLYSISLKYKYISLNQVLKFVFNLGEIYIQHLHSISLDFNPDSRYSWDKELANHDELVVPSVVFCKYAGHLVPYESPLNTAKDSTSYILICANHDTQGLDLSDYSLNSKKSSQTPQIYLEAQFKIKDLILNKRNDNQDANATNIDMCAIKVKENNSSVNINVVKAEISERTYHNKINFKVFAGHIFFSYEIVSRIQKVLNDYKDLVSIYKNEKNILWSSQFTDNIVSPILLVGAVSKKDEIKEKSSDDILLDTDFTNCRGYSPKLLTTSSNNSYVFDWCIVLENTTFHILLGIEQLLYEGNNIENRLLDIHRKSLQYSGDSFTIIRPLYCYNKKNLNSNFYNPRIAILTAESIGIRISSFIKIAFKNRPENLGDCLNSGISIALNNKCARDLRSWILDLLIREIDIMILRNGTWGILDFSFRRIKLLLKSHNNEPVVNSSKDLNIINMLNEFNQRSIISLLHSNISDFKYIKFTIRDFCIWSILYERNRCNFSSKSSRNSEKEASNMEIGKNIFDMFYTNIDFSLEYVCLTPERNALLEYSSILLPEFTTIEKFQEIENTAKNSNNLILPGWSYGLILPPQTPFSDKMYLQNSTPKLFPVFGKRSIPRSNLDSVNNQKIGKSNEVQKYSQGTDLSDSKSKLNGQLFKKNKKSIQINSGKFCNEAEGMQILPLFSFEALDQDICNTDRSINASVVISPTFMTLLPNFFRQLIDIFHFIEKFMNFEYQIENSISIDGSETNSENSKDENLRNIPIVTSTSLQSNNVTTLSSNNLSNRDIKVSPDDLCISDEAYTSESCGTPDAILNILEKIKVIPLSSISLKAQLHTMVITFPEFHDTILTQSISSEHFDGFNYSPSRDRYLVATFSGIYRPAIAVKCNFNICYLKLNNDELIGSENATNNNGETNSAKLELDISNIRLQFPYVQNIGENFVFEESSSLQGMHNHKSSKKNISCPILDIFVPSIHSYFILTKVITCSSSIQAGHDELNDPGYLCNLNETGVVLGSLSISSIFAFDAAEIPIIDNTHLIRSSILGDHIKDVCVNQQGKGYSDEIINSCNPEGNNIYFDHSELTTMDSQILSISFNLKGGSSIESQLELKCFRFIFSLTTVNLSVPYIQRVLSWWDDLWTIRIRFPRCTNSTMRYFLVDMCSDKLYSSSYGLTTRNQHRNQCIKLNSFPIKNSEFCNSVYTVNIYDYWQHELTNPLYFPLDISVPIVLALPPTSVLVCNVRPYNSIRRSDNFTPSLLNSHVKYYGYEFRFKKLMNSKQILSISGNSSLANIEKLRNICFTSKLTEQTPTLSEISRIITGISNSRETVDIKDGCNPVYGDDCEEFGNYPSRSQIGENKDEGNKNSLSIHISEEDANKVVSNSVDYHLLSSAMNGIHKMAKIVRYPIIYSWSTIRQKLLSTDKSNLTTNIDQNFGSINESTKVVDEINFSNVNDNFLGCNSVHSKEEMSRTNNNSIENIKSGKFDYGPGIDEPGKLNFVDDKLAKFKVLSTISKKISKVGKSKRTKSRDYNTYSSGDYLNNENSNECAQLVIENIQTTQSKQRLNIQVIIENLEIWVHRDLSLEKSGDTQIIKDSEIKNSNMLSSKRLNKKLPPELTLEEAAIDWIAKSVYCVPPVKRRSNSINESSSELLLNEKTNMSMELKEYKFDSGNIELHSVSEGYQYNPFYQNLLDSNQDRSEDDESTCSCKQPTLEYGTRILFPNTFEIYNFRRNIGYYDQTGFDYVMKSNRYGRRQTLAVHRNARASSNGHFFPIRNSFKGSYNTNSNFVDVSKNEKFNSFDIFRNSDRINSNAKDLTGIYKHNQYKSHENNIKSLGTAFSILISMNIAIDITECDFQASANCNELRILPGFPISLNNKILFSGCNISPKYEEDGENTEPIESNLQFFSVPNNCNCNYCSILFQKKWLTIVSLNGGNIYMPLVSNLPSSVKRDFLLYLNGAKLSIKPCCTLRSKRSDTWTSYETNVELYVGEVTISLSMDLIRELHIYKEYLYSIKGNIDKYIIHHPKHIYSYISPESILCPYTHTDSFDIFKDSGMPASSIYKNKGRLSMIRQPLPLIINPAKPENKIRCIASQVSIVEATKEIKYQLEVSNEEQLKSNDISRYSENKDVTDRELDSQVTSSEDEEDSTSSVCENQIVLLTYSGFPLPSSKSYYLPKSAKIQLQKQVNYERHGNRRFGIFVPEDLNLPSVEMHKGGDEGSSGNKSLISDHLLYSSILKIIRLTSTSLEWLMAKNHTENLEKTMRKKNILHLPKVHWDKCNQFIFEYNQPCFDVIIYNDYTDLLRFSVETSHGIAQYPNTLSCKFKSIISTITHDPVIDCMITIIRPFLINLDISLQNQAESLNFQCKSNSIYPDLNYGQTYMDKSLLRCQVMLINLRTESISLEITSGFLQNIKLVISDLENFNLLGLVYAYQRKIHTVKIINDMGQSTLLVQPIYNVGDYPDIVNDATTNPNCLKFANYLDPPYFADFLGYKSISVSGSSITGLRTQIINRNEYCLAAIYLPIHLAIQKFIHRKGQKIAARLQAMENSDNKRYLIKLGHISEKTNLNRNSNIGSSANRMNASSEIKHHEISIPQATSAMIMHNIQDITSDSINDTVNYEEATKDHTAIQNKSAQITVRKKGKKNATQNGGKSSIYNSSIILNDITKEIYRLGDTNKSYNFQGSKHMWLSGKMYDLLYGSTRIVESEFYQLAEQLELATPYLGGNGGLETIIHRFFLTQPIWSLLGRMKDDTMHMRSYRFGTLGFLVVLEPEPGANTNEWIWTLGTCVQIENSTNITLRITVTWRHGIRRFCGALFTDSDKGINARVENGSHMFPCIDIPPFSRRSIPLSWFLLSDMEPTIVPILTKTVDQEDEDDQHLLNIEDIHEFNKNNFADYSSGNSNKDNFTRRHNLAINNKSVRRIQSKLHPVPFSTLRKLIYEITSIQPANVTKTNISTESFSLIFETLMAFSGRINVVDIPTVDKYVTSYRYTIKITPFMTMMNILPFPIQIRFQMSSGIKIPVEALALQYNVIPEIKFPNIIAFAENKFKSLAASSIEDNFNAKYMDSDPTNNSLVHSNDDGTTCNGSTSDKSRFQNSILKKLENIYRDEFAILIEFLSGRPVDIILQPQQELALTIFRHKLEMILYINGCPLEGCHFPIYTNTLNSPEYIQAQNALINEFIYRSNKFSVSFPFGDAISHSINLDRIIGNPYNAWGPFYSKVLQNYYLNEYSGLESNGLKSTNKLYDCLNHLTVNIRVSSRKIIFSSLARIENTTDSILCLFLNENTSLNISSANNTSVPLPLPPSFRYFTSHENMKNLRISSLAITTSLPTFHKYNIQTIANNIKINYVSKISSKIDTSTAGVCIPLIKLPLIRYQEKISDDTSHQTESKSENLENRDGNDTLINTSLYEDSINYENDQMLTFGVTIHQNDLLSYMNCPVATFYNRYELVSQLPFPILIHKFTTARKMHQKIQSCLNECEDYEILSKEASNATFIFQETGKQEDSTKFHRVHNNKLNELGSIKLPPITSLSSSILLRPNERRPYHQVDPRVWISKPIINNNEPFLTSRDFSFFSGCKMEYSSQPSKFQVALYPQQQEVRASNGVNGNSSSNQIGSNSNKLNNTAKLSSFTTPFLLTLHLIPGILGSSASSAAIGNSGYFVIFSVAEAPFFKICNLSSYYIAYQTPDTSKVHNYYYRGKKAVFGAASNTQFDDFTNENSPDGDIDDMLLSSSLIDSSLKNKRIVDVDNTKNYYSYPNLGAAKSADISVIPPHTSIPYIPKDWDCEYIGIMPLNVKKSNWTTHSITSIKDEIYVITFVKHEEIIKVIPATDKLQSALSLETATNIENSLKDEAVELQSDYKIQSGNSGVLSDTKSTIVDKNNTQKNSKRIKYGKLYTFLMVNSQGTRILIIMENRKSAEKVLSGHFAILNQNIIQNGFENNHFDFSNSSNIVMNSLSSGNNQQINDLSLSSNAEETKSSIIQQSAMKYYYISKLSWIGLKFSFFIPRTSVSWIHQNELVIVWHGSLFQIVGSILPDNIYSMMILDFTCDLLMRKCMELVGLENSTCRAEHTIKGSFFDIPFRKNKRATLKPLFSDGIASLISNEEKILNPKQNPDIIDFDMGTDMMRTFNTKSMNIVDLDENRHFEYIGGYIKKIFLFLSKNIRNMGGSFSVGENHALRQALLLLKRTYKDCILREKFYVSKLYLDQKSYADNVQKQYSSFKIYSRSHSDLKDSKYSLFNSEFKSKQNALLSFYDDALNSMIQTISLLSSQMENALLINGRFTIKIGLESIHIDHFLPGDIPVILKTTSNKRLSSLSNKLSHNLSFKANDIERNTEELERQAEKKVKSQNYDTNENQDLQVSMNDTDNIEVYDHNGETTKSNSSDDSRFISLTIARSLMNPIYAPIFDKIVITVSPISCNLERLVVQSLYFMVFKEIENMTNIADSRKKALWMSSTRQKPSMIQFSQRNNLCKDKSGPLVCYVSGGFSLPMYITRTPWEQLRIGRPMYIRTLEISDVAVTISIRTSDDTINIDTLTSEALLFMNILPLDTPHMILNVNPLKKDALVADFAEFFHFLMSSYSREFKRRILPSVGVSHLVAIYSGLKRGVYAIMTEVNRGLSDPELSSLEGLFQGLRIGFIHFFRYFLGGTFQTASVIFNFGHKLLGGRRPRPNSILDAIWNGILGFLIDTFITPWVLLYKTPIDTFRKTKKRISFALALIFSLIRIAICPLFGLLNFLASITEGLATALIGDFEQFVHVQSRSELMKEIENNRYHEHDEIRRFGV
ncbi:hypothetical protein ACR3K2_07970 [Cryptosporidium serpentis]